MTKPPTTGTTLLLWNDNAQIRELGDTEAPDLSEYKNTNGLLERYQTYYIKPVWRITRSVQFKLLTLGDDVQGFLPLPESSIFLITTCLSAERLQEIMTPWVDGEFQVMEFEEVEG